MTDQILTIITVVRDDQAGLNKTIKSVESSLPLAEHLIVDGSDVPLQIALSSTNIKVVRGRDRGIAHAFNKGVLGSSGEYILFINAGDTLLEGVGGYIQATLQENPADCHWFSVLRQYVSGKTSMYSPRTRWLRLAMSAPHQGMILRKEVIAEIGLFPLQKYSMDHYLAARLLALPRPISLIVHECTIAIYPVGGHSTRGGCRPFVSNCWNVARISPWLLPVAVILNTYLAMKTYIFQYIVEHE